MMLKGETELQKNVCHYLDVACPEVVYAATPNQQVMSGVVRGLCIKLFGEVKGKEYADTILSRIVAGLKATGLTPGWPDIVLHWHPSKTLYLELKTPTRSVKPEQKAIHSRLKAIGHSCVIVRSLSDLQHAVREHQIPCRDIAMKSAGLSQ
jgi:hypothetical protein